MPLDLPKEERLTGRDAMNTEQAKEKKAKHLEADLGGTAEIAVPGTKIAFPTGELH